MNKAYFAIIVGIIGLVYGIYCLIKLILVRNWPTTAGEVIVSDKTFRGAGFQKFEDAEITYQYSVAGKQYKARVIQAGGDISASPSKTENNVDKILGKYPPGSLVTVHYNPRFPQMACLEHSDATVVFIGLVFGPLAIGVGYFLLR